MEKDIKNYKSDKNSAQKANGSAALDLLNIPAYLSSIQSGRTGADRAMGIGKIAAMISGFLPE